MKSIINAAIIRRISGKEFSRSVNDYNTYAIFSVVFHLRISD